MKAGQVARSELILGDAVLRDRAGAYLTTVIPVSLQDQKFAEVTHMKASEEK